MAHSFVLRLIACSRDGDTGPWRQGASVSRVLTLDAIPESPTRGDLADSIAEIGDLLNSHSLPIGRVVGMTGKARTEKV